MGRLEGRGLKARIKGPASPAGLSMAASSADSDRRRDASDPWRALYKTARWQRLVRKIRARDGYVCQQTGEALIGKHPAPNSPVVDHKVPAHEFWWDGRRQLFWDEGNLQTVSKQWHDGVKQKAEHAARRAPGVGGSNR